MDAEPDAHRRRLIETLFARAVDLNLAERTSLLDDACATDADMRSQIESLLAADTGDDQFIEAVISDAALELPEPEQPGTDAAMAGQRIGPYRIVELIGKGGMGAVYRAIREDQFHMRVALKLIKRGADTDFAIHQLWNERQILARLEHSNIARLLDGALPMMGSPTLSWSTWKASPSQTTAGRRRSALPPASRYFARFARRFITPTRI